jgi:hypothetical protein
LIDFLQREHPDALPRMRAELDRAEHDTAHPEAAPPPVRAGKGDSSAIKQPSHPEVQVAGDARAPAQAQTDVTGKGA